MTYSLEWRLWNRTLEPTLSPQARLEGSLNHEEVLNVGEPMHEPFTLRIWVWTDVNFRLSRTV